MKNTFLLVFFFSSLFSFTILSAQTYKTGFDNTAEQLGWAQYRVGAIDPFYEWEYTLSEAFSNPNCIVHNYPVGGTEVTEDWFVSPVFDFSEGGTIDSIWHRFSGFGLPLAGDTVAIYVINGAADPDLATSKTLLFNYVDTSYANDGVWTLNTDISIPSLPDDSYLAFRYKTVSNWLDVRFDDLTVTSNNTTATNPLTVPMIQLEVFPNPIQDHFNIETINNLTIKSIALFTNEGKRVKQFNSNERSFSLVGFSPGSYILTIETDQGIVSKKLVKN